MRRFCKFLKFLVFSFTLFIFFSSPQPALAAPLDNIFSSPDSFIVKIQERIEYFFAFRTEQKIIVLEKQAERRLTQATNLAKTKDINQVISLIKSYETLKEKQGDLIESAPTTDLTMVKEQTIKQQARIEDMKKGMQDDAKEIIEESQRIVIKTTMDNLDDSGTKKDKDEVAEFTKEVKNVLDPESHIFAPGTNEVAPGTLEVAPGTLEVAP